MTPTEFRQRYPNFRNAADTMIQTYLDIADDLLGSAWRDSLRTLGIGLFTAHHLSLNGCGMDGGSSSGPVQSKSVDTVSVSYDTSIAAQQGAGFWNSTSYGREFAYWLRIVGVLQGPRQFLPPFANG